MSSVKLAEVASQHLPAPVPYAVLTPDDGQELPLCILLMGGGGTRDALFDLQPLFDEWWRNGVVLPMVIATPTPGFDYYVEDPSGPVRWDTFVLTDFVPLLRSNFASSRYAIAGISGGGYGRSRWRSCSPRYSTQLR